MTTGGGGFESGADYIAAKVSIDVDASGITTLREMSQEIDRVRTATEAAARGGANFVQGINQMVQAARTATQSHRDLAQAMQQTADLQARGATGGSGTSQMLPLSRLAPGSYTDPWAGMGAGTGGSRQPSPSDIQHQIVDPTRQLDPRKYINAQAGRYNIQPGEMPTQNLDEPSLAATANRIDAREKQGQKQEDAVNREPGSGGGSGGGRGSGGGGGRGRFGGLASNIMNEMSPGGSHAGMINMASRGLGALSKSLSGMGRPSGAVAAGEGSAAEGGETALTAASQGAETAEGMGIGALGAAGLAGGAVAGLAAVEKGGAIYQGYKNIGNIQGKGAGSGFGDEMAMRTMALNPFISTEQSRQVIMAGLTEGYSGKQFDTVTQFMADNLKNMNISVADSVQLLRTNVNQGQQSVLGLGASLAVLKGMAPGSAMSMPDMVANLGATSGALVAQGQPGGIASQESLAGMGVWDDNQALKGDFNQIMGGFGSSPQGGALLKAWGGANTPAGLNPAMASAYMGAHGGGTGKATGQALLHIYQQSFRSSASKQKGSVEYFNSLYTFQRLLAVVSPNDPAVTNTDVAQQMVDQLASGANPFDAGQKKANDASSKVNGSQGVMGSLGGLGDIIGHTVTDIGRDFAGVFTGNNEAIKNAGADWRKTWGNASYNDTAQASTPVLDNVVGQLGAGNVQVVDSQGNASPLTGSKQQVSDLAANKLKWRPKGSTGEGYTLQQTPSVGTLPGGNGGGQTNVNFAPAQVQISFDSSGRPSASPNPAQLTPNAQAVNSGQGSSTLNNAPVDQGNGYFPKGLQ